MADDVTLPGTGAIVAADEIDGKKHQRIKVQFGVNGSATDVSEDDPLPVTMALQLPDSLGIKTAADSLSVTVASDDALLVGLGAKGDASAPSDTGTFSLIAFVKRGQEKLTSIAGGIVNIVTAIGAMGDAAWTTGNGSVIAVLKSIATAVTTPISIKSPGAVVTFIPALDTSAYAAGDVLWTAITSGNLVPANDQPMVLQSVTVIDKDDEGAQITLYFFSANVAFGTVNGAPTISDADAVYLLGIVDIASADYKDLGGAKVASKTGLSLPIVPVAGGRNIFVAATTSGTPTFASASDISVRLGVI